MMADGLRRRTGGIIPTAPGTPASRTSATTVAPKSSRSPGLRATAACWIGLRWAVERLTGPLRGRT